MCNAGSFSEAMIWHMSGVPNLEGLEPHEQAAVARAVSKTPEDRFPSCGEFARALRCPTPAVPPPPHGRADKWRLLGVGILMAVLAALLAMVVATRPKILPPNGFAAAADARIIPDGDSKHFDRIVRRVGDSDVSFLFIPHAADGPPAFYMMENKVSNGMYKAALADQAFQVNLKKLQEDYPTLKWGRQNEGSLINGVTNGSDVDDFLPVFRINILEAHCFARWLGGDLPTDGQWDAAGGKFDKEKAPFQDPDEPLRQGDVAVGRRAEGPMAIGAAKRNISVHNCRDMAGNGIEWTRTYNGGSVFPPPPTADLRHIIVSVRRRGLRQGRAVSIR